MYVLISIMISVAKWNCRLKFILLTSNCFYSVFHVNLWSNEGRVVE